jgi:aminopeptidase N
MSRSGWTRGRRVAKLAIPTALVPALLLATLAGPATAAPIAGPDADGAPGIGDPYFPLYGNGGYDVEHYDVNVKVDGTAPSGTVAGTTTIHATALQNLDSFDLDFKLGATSVKVDGVTADFTNGTDRELTIKPATRIQKDAEFAVEVKYSATPDSIFEDGFNPVYAGSGGMLIIGEPTSAPWWFPSNDHPRDKAIYDIHISVPTDVEALTIGKLVSVDHGAQRDTWNWKVNQPSVPYLVFLATGQYDVSKTTLDGRPVVTAIGEGSGVAGEAAAADFARLDEVVHFLESQFGKYRFDVNGNVVVQTSLGFALECMTRPTYSPLFWAGGQQNISVVVHETAHQWWGDNVSVHNWRDVWLNEGFASFAAWRWEEFQGGTTAQEMLASTYNGQPEGSSYWNFKIGDPGPTQLFAPQVYSRGAMTVQALRNRIGNANLLEVFGKWNKKHLHANGSIRNFEKLAEHVSGEDLNGFFKHWLYDPVKPAKTAENGLEDVGSLMPADVPGWTDAQRKLDQLIEFEANVG